MKQFKYIFLILAGVTLSGCSLFGGNNNASNLIDGGVYRSVDGGLNWGHVIQIPTTNEVKPNIGRVDVLSVKNDPQDRFALYIGSRGQGLFYTYSGGNAWIKAQFAEQSSIVDIAVDPSSKCRIYAASGNRLFKSTDCSRTWQGTYLLDNPNRIITALDINPFETNTMFAGDASGDVFISNDYGVSWNTVARFENEIVDIQIDSNATSTMYIATKSKGLRKSTDNGLTWEDISIETKEFKGAQTFRALVLSPSETDTLYVSTKYGILKSMDAGESWSDIPLLTKPREADIFGLAVDPKNPNILYYTTKRTFYKSVDSGATWSTQELPTRRIPTALVVDPVDTNVIYMTVANPAS